MTHVGASVLLPEIERDIRELQSVSNLIHVVYDSLTLRIILREKPITLCVQTVCKRSSMGADRLQMFHKHAVIGRNIKQQNFNEESSEGKC